MIRKTLEMTQPEMDAFLKIGKGSWQRYESRGVNPGSEVISKLVEAGFDANWILAGQGELHHRALEDTGISDAPGDYAIYKVPPSVDRDKIASLILLIEQRIADALPPNMKARMAADLIIQYLEGENDEST